MRAITFLKFTPNLLTLFYVISNLLGAIIYVVYIVMFCVNDISLNKLWEEYFQHISIFIRQGGKIMCIRYINKINEMQQYAGVYLLQIYSTCFGCLSHP